MENTIKNPLEYRGGVNFQDSYTKIIGTFFHDSTSSGLIDNSISKRNKVSIALKTTETFDRSLAIMESGLYQNTGGSDLSALFIPFVATVNSNMNMPSVSGLDGDLDEINARTLLPFEFNASGINKFKDLNSLSASGDAVVGLVSANRYYDSPLNIRQVSDVRGIGLRLPLMGIGWGYNTNNEKIPAGSGANKFKGEVDYGWQVDPKDYIAAPIDLR